MAKLDELWRFYWLVIRKILTHSMKTAHTIHTLLFLAGCLLVLVSFGWKQVSPVWGGALVLVAIVGGLPLAIYDTHRDLLKRRGERLFWAYKDGGGFYRDAGTESAEVSADGDRVATFREVACTEEFTELLDRSREIRIRLLAEESQLKASGKPTFAPYHEGGWMKPENPILTKCGLEVALVGTAQRL